MQQSLSKILVRGPVFEAVALVIFAAEHFLLAYVVGTTLFAQVLGS
jgi:hypothetical protein